MQKRHVLALFLLTLVTGFVAVKEFLPEAVQPASANNPGNNDRRVRDSDVLLLMADNYNRKTTQSSPRPVPTVHRLVEKKPPSTKRNVQKAAPAEEHQLPTINARQAAFDFGTWSDSTRYSPFHIVWKRPVKTDERMKKLDEESLTGCCDEILSLCLVSLLTHYAKAEVIVWTNDFTTSQLQALVPSTRAIARSYDVKDLAKGTAAAEWFDHHEFGMCL